MTDRIRFREDDLPFHEAACFIEIESLPNGKTLRVRIFQWTGDDDYRLKFEGTLKELIEKVGDEETA